MSATDAWMMVSTSILSVTVMIMMMMMMMMVMMVTMMMIFDWRMMVGQ